MSSAELPDREPDVLVVGAGNAALRAAISAHENGARVLMLEAAPFEERGGNSHFTGGAARRNLPWSVCRAMPQPGPGGAVTQLHNLKAAKPLGIKISDNLLSLADEMIE
jgi:glycine/D-amino acid oxidase-like deaminating enzyme